MKKLFAILRMILASLFLFAGCGGDSMRIDTFPNHKVTNKTVLETEVFLDKPDSVIAINKGEATLDLSTEQQDEIYSRFMSLMESFEEASCLKTYFQYSKKYVNERLDSKAAFEFRYDQRRNFTGELKSFGASSIFTWGELKFDAFLFIFDGGHIAALPYMDGSYKAVCNHLLLLTFEGGSYEEFKAFEAFVTACCVRQ